MSFLPTLPRKHVPRSPGLASSRGWIGLDISCHSVRLAQVERRDGRIQLTHRWVCPLDAPSSAEFAPGELLSSNISNLAKLRKMFRMSKCAATLPQTLITLRSFELPQVNNREMHDMVAQELAVECEQRQEEFSFGFWSPMIDGDLTNVTALSVSKSVATQIVRDLARGGFTCQVLDGIPCALARAVALANDSDEPAAILDLSDTAMTFVIAATGTPQFTRVLRGGGLYSLLASLRETLQLTHEQSMQLLGFCPLASTDTQPGAVPAVAAQLIENSLSQLLDELARTLMFVKQQFPAIAPSCLWLVGEGTGIRGLPEYFNNKLHIPVKLWRLPATEITSNEDAPYGVAAALSVLRWEYASCT